MGKIPRVEDEGDQKPGDDQASKAATPPTPPAEAPEGPVMARKAAETVMRSYEGTVVDVANVNLPGNKLIRVCFVSVDGGLPVGNMAVIAAKQIGERIKITVE